MTTNTTTIAASVYPPKVQVVKDLHPKKAFFPMVSTVLGIVNIKLYIYQQYNQ